MTRDSLPMYEKGMALDSYWTAMSKVMTPLQKARFPTVVPLALAALSLSHYNADQGRCFSCLEKIQWDDRENLFKHTVNALYVVPEVQHQHTVFQDRYYRRFVCRGPKGVRCVNWQELWQRWWRLCLLAYMIVLCVVLFLDWRWCLCALWVVTTVMTNVLACIYDLVMRCFIFRLTMIIICLWNYDEI